MLRCALFLSPVLFLKSGEANINLFIYNISGVLESWSALYTEPQQKMEVTSAFKWQQGLSSQLNLILFLFYLCCHFLFGRYFVHFHFYFFPYLEDRDSLAE